MKLFITEEEIRKIFAKAEESPRDFALLHVMASTGLRISDILKLTRADVVGSGGGPARYAIRVRQRKTGNSVDVTLRPDARAAIEAYLASRRDSNPWLFISEAGNRHGSRTPLGARGAQNIVKLYLLGLGYDPSAISGSATHTLRRSVAKLIAIKAGRIEPATKFLGHKSVASTMSYIDGSYYEQQARDIVGKLEW